MWYYKWPYYAIVPNSISTSGEPSTDGHIQWYNYDKMPAALYNNTADYEANMVATLLRDCGYAAKMEYREDGSAAGLKDAMEALSNTFAYSSNISYQKKSQTINWVKKLKAEIDAGRPILYTAYTKDGEGHTFVLYGYKGDMFYVNWGWGNEEENTGTYALDLLRAKVNDNYIFTTSHQALFGIEPAPLCSSPTNTGTLAGSVPFIQIAGGDITMKNCTISANAKCYCYSGTQIRLTDGFVAKAGSFAHFAIRDVPCENTRSIMHAPAYEDPATEEKTDNLATQPKRQLSVMPNPATDRISVQCEAEVVSVMIFTTMGQQVLSARETDIDISHLPAGTYILYARTTSGAERTMFIRQ